MFTFDEELFELAGKDFLLAKEMLQKKQTELTDISYQIEDDDIKNDFQEVINDMNKVEEKLEELEENQQRTKSVIDSIAAKHKEKVEKDKLLRYELDDSFYTEIYSKLEGMYGANQSAPFWILLNYLLSPNSLKEIDKEKAKDMFELFIDHGHTVESTMVAYLDLMRTQGCGYINITNTICDIYKDKPEEFEEIYGYPLYYEDENGDKIYNFETIVTDLFLRNHKNLQEEKYFYSIGFATEEPISMEKALKTLVPELNFEVKVMSRDCSIDTYKEYMEEGNYQYAYIAVHSFELRPCNNTEEENFVATGGHWMPIIGVNENNHYIVASVGKPWELIRSSPYIYDDKSFFLGEFEGYQGIGEELDEHDGGLIFIKVGDKNEN